MKTDLPPRFWEKVDQSGECWIWTAYKSHNGYGRFMYNRRVEAAHRLSYIDRNGSIPAGLEIDHLCRNRACVNPDHLEAVTRQVNVRRGLAPLVASRHITAFNIARGQALLCRQGHEYTDANTVIRVGADGYSRRECQECKRARMSVNNERRRMRTRTKGMAA